MGEICSTLKVPPTRPSAYRILIILNAERFDGSKGEIISKYNPMSLTLVAPLPIVSISVSIVSIFTPLTHCFHSLRYFRSGPHSVGGLELFFAAVTKKADICDGNSGATTMPMVSNANEFQIQESR
jgi:hypothetical protein